MEPVLVHESLSYRPAAKGRGFPFFRALNFLIRVHFPGRMTAAVNLLQLEDADLGINGGGFQVGVTEQLLDVADVGPAFKHVGGAGVT